LASIEPLSGRRCSPRALVPADAPSLRVHADDEAVWRTLFDGFPRPYTLADAQAWCGDSRPALFGHVWGIEVAGEIAGCVGVRPDAGWLRRSSLPAKRRRRSRASAATSRKATCRAAPSRLAG